MLTTAVRTVLVEDQPNIAAHLRSLLEKRADINFLAAAGSVKVATDVIAATQPTLVIMDIELGDGTAFDILKALSPLTFQVIFVTAFKEYAIKAIKYGAMDYLLKPIDPLELHTALAKLHYQAPDTRQLEVMEQHYLQPGKTGRIALRCGPLLKIVALDTILYLESGEGTTVFLQDGQQLVVKKSMKDFEELLPDHQFLRIHASVIVNIAHVDHYRPPDALVLHNGTVLTIAARRKDSLIAYLTGK